MSSDVLSEVLRAVRLTGAVFFRLEAAPPWVANAPAASAVAVHVLPGAEHVIEYHVVARGSCWARIVDGPAVCLQEGDVIVFPQGDAHVISSAPDLSGTADLALFRHPEGSQLPISLSFNPEGKDRAQIVCGFLGCDARPFNPLLATLPRMLHVPRDPAGHGAALEHLIAIAVGESSQHRAGGQVMLARLSELLFIEVVRRHVSTLPPGSTGFYAGLRDEVVGRTLGILHDRPAHDWTLESLAKAVGLSRSMLAERFHDYVGLPPMQYLASWRMQLAASLLSGTSLGLSEIAARVGYGSEAALSRAFKRLVGVAPSAWREGARPGSSGSRTALTG